MYEKRYVPGRHRCGIPIHRLRAERALGRLLPPSAKVHHADGSTSSSAPLVICEDEAYHQLLHRRMRVKTAGGNPNTDKLCYRCKRVKPQTDFGKSACTHDGLAGYCKACRKPEVARVA